MSQSFDILSEDRREYRLFNTVGTQLTARLNTPTDVGTTNPVDNIMASMNELFEHAL
jgi:predicted SPOUT superfamily RNA methylase MTH1